MPNLFCFGLGYTAEHYIADFGARFDRIAGTVRGGDRTTRLARDGIGANQIDAIVFDGASATAEITAVLEETDTLLVSVPPDSAGDPVLRCFGEALARSPRLRNIVYLSTVGVYGDHDGGWVDETTEPKPVSPRSRARLDAERAWAAFAERAGKTVAILRLAGIYGPGRNALRQIADGTAKRILKPGQVFNRIHVGDIAQAIEAAFARAANGVFNLADDEPTAPGEPIRFAADLLAMAAPPEIPFAQAARAMSPMAISFYRESKRVRNDKLKRDLGVRLIYPTYREGLRALFDADKRRPPN